MTRRSKVSHLPRQSQMKFRMKMGLFLLILIFCVKHSEQFLYNRSSSQLSEYPQDRVPSNTTVIILNNNAKTLLAAGILKQTPLVKKFYVANNRLTGMDRLAFQGSNLTIYDARNNLLKISHQYNSRNEMSLVQPIFRTVRYTFNSLIHLRAKFCNCLPNGI